MQPHFITSPLHLTAYSMYSCIHTCIAYSLNQQANEECVIHAYIQTHTWTCHLTCVCMLFCVHIEAIRSSLPFSMATNSVPIPFIYDAQIVK